MSSGGNSVSSIGGGAATGPQQPPAQPNQPANTHVAAALPPLPRLPEFERTFPRMHTAQVAPPRVPAPPMVPFLSMAPTLLMAPALPVDRAPLMAPALPMARALPMAPAPLPPSPPSALGFPSQTYTVQMQQLGVEPTGMSQPLPQGWPAPLPQLRLFTLPASLQAQAAFAHLVAANLAPHPIVGKSGDLAVFQEDSEASSSDASGSSGSFAAPDEWALSQGEVDETLQTDGLCRPLQVCARSNGSVVNAVLSATHAIQGFFAPSQLNENDRRNACWDELNHAIHSLSDIRGLKAGNAPGEIVEAPYSRAFVLAFAPTFARDVCANFVDRPIDESTFDSIVDSSISYRGDALFNAYVNAIVDKMDPELQHSPG